MLTFDKFKLKENPFRVVPAINSKELIWAGFRGIKETFETRILRSMLIPNSAIVLNWGDYGSGKTHAARYFCKDNVMQELAERIDCQAPLSIMINFPRGKKVIEEIYTQIMDKIDIGYLRANIPEGVNINDCIKNSTDSVYIQKVLEEMFNDRSRTVEQVKAYRLASPKPATQKKAETPTLFDEVRECSSDYVAIPKVSSENRRYIPLDYLSKDIIPGDSLFMIQGISLYHFGVLTSNVHMAWMRTVCGRLKSDYRYSKDIVYNNFPWPSPTPEQKTAIEQTAQGILDARAKYPDCSLADLYDETTMPPELRKAHQQNDRAVMQAYGFSVKMTESECVAELMKLYRKLTEA